MEKKEKLARLQLAKLKGVGSVTFKKILEEYDSAAAYLTSKGHTLRSDDHLDWPLSATVVYGEQQYPKLLAELFDPPTSFYFRGDLSLLDRPCISIVGTRKNTTYGQVITERLVMYLVKQGFVIVSGMAMGIDAIAHRAALKAGGKTIAVLGTPIDRAYPDIHKKLYEELVQTQLVISEYAPGGGAFSGSFAQRNRLIAGVSLATIVIEAPERSGALITAHLAFDHNRYVYAVPGNLGSESSQGTNMLIRTEKAKLLNDPAQILEDLNMQIGPSTDWQSLEQQLDGVELEIVRKLAQGSNHLDDLLEYVKISPAELMQRLSNLELQGIIGRDQGSKYYLK